MAASRTITVPHLGGIRAGYAISGDGHIDPSKPTIVLLNSMCMTVSLYNAQFADKRLTSAANFVAIEPLGHGATTTTSEAIGHFTYWDSAIMALQVMDALEIAKAYALGTSQGGWIVTRMALLAPGRIAGLLLLGTSMDYESSASREKGCWDPKTLLSPFLEKWAAPAAAEEEEEEGGKAEFVVDDVWCGLVGGFGFGDQATPEVAAYWTNVLKEVYRGEEGRKNLRLALLNLLSRDGLLLRLGDVQCPVHWLQVRHTITTTNLCQTSTLKSCLSCKSFRKKKEKTMHTYFFMLTNVLDREPRIHHTVSRCPPSISSCSAQRRGLR